MLCFLFVLPSLYASFFHSYRLYSQPQLRMEMLIMNYQQRLRSPRKTLPNGLSLYCQWRWSPLFLSMSLIQHLPAGSLLMVSIYDDLLPLLGFFLICWDSQVLVAWTNTLGILIFFFGFNKIYWICYNQ